MSQVPNPNSNQMEIPGRSRPGRKSFKELGVLVALAGVCVVIGIINPVFFMPTNLLNVLRQISLMGIIAVGGAMVIITGGIDLSVGSFLSFGGVACAALALMGVNPWIAMILALLACIGLGAVTGVIIVYLRITPFIVTLAMMNIVKGMSFMVTKGKPVQFQTELDFLGGTLGPIPVPVIFMFAIMIVGHIVLAKTEFGRKVYAVGGNEKAAELSGIRVARIKLAVYAITAGLAAFSGVLTAANMSSAETSAGAGYELDVIAAVVIGGASLSGGRGTMLGVLIGAAILGVIRNGFVLLMIPNYWQMMTIGFVIIIACAIDEFRRGRGN